MTDETIIDRRKRGLARLRQLVRESTQESADAHVRAQQRKAERCAAPPVAPPAPPDVPDFDCVGARPERAPTAADVEQWWHAAVAAAFDGRVKQGAWTIADRTNAKKALNQYGADVVQRGIVDVVAGWEQREAVRAGRMAPVPTWGLIYVMREAVFGVLAAGVERNTVGAVANRKKGDRIKDKEALRKERRAMGEYNPLEKDPAKRKGSGW